MNKVLTGFTQKKKTAPNNTMAFVHLHVLFEPCYLPLFAGIGDINVWRSAVYTLTECLI